MKYHFEYDERGHRLFVAELDEELDNIDASDEDVDCTGGNFSGYDRNFRCRPLHKPVSGFK